jgi:adenylate cyclase
LLAEFGSVVDAVECAVSLQRGMAERNEGVAEGKRIDVRMGINLGDVIIEGDDRHGEGVVIAARLQQLADPGGIALTRTVAENIKHKLALGLESQFPFIASQLARAESVLTNRNAAEDSLGYGRRSQRRCAWL